MGYIKDKTGWDIGDPIMSLGNVVEKVNREIISVVEGIGKTIEGILKDPLPTLLQIGGAMVGIPPYVTAAVITAARGGNFEDIAKSAAVSYISSQAMSNTSLGKTIGNITKTAGQDFTNSIMENFNLPADTAIAVSRAATASLNSSIIGGVNAAISGKNVMDGITSGFTSGLISSSTNSYFDSLNKDPNWGFSPDTLNLMKGSSSAALQSIVSGKGDPSQAVGNYIASAFIGMGESKLKQAANEAWTNLTTDTNAAKAAQDKFNTAKAEYDDKAKKGEALRKEINDDSASYQSTITNQYNPFKTAYDKLTTDSTAAINTFNEQKKIFDDNKWSYDNYTEVVKKYGMHQESYSAGDYDYTQWVSDAPSKDSFLTAANTAATAANAAAKNAETIQASAKKLYDDNKPMLDSLTNGKAVIDKKVSDFQAIRTDIENPAIPGSTAANLKASSDAFQTSYDAWSKTKSAADRSAENFTKALAQAATRDATIDALNTGAIKVTSKDADSNWFLSNGMILTPQGKFVQDGQQVFTEAAGVPQKAMDFTANDGSNVDFSPDAGRLLSQTDVVNICKRDYGFTPTSDEIDRLAGTPYTATGNKDITALADQKATAAFSSVTGKAPTADELAAIKKTNNVVGSAISLAKTGDADPWGNLEGSMLKAAEGDAVKFTDAQLTDMVRKGLVFEGGDYSTKQDAANAARLKGYTQFEYDNDVYTMQPNGPTEKALFQSVIDMQPNKKEAFRKARELLGADKEFPYQGSNYTTSFWKPIPQPDAEIIGDGSVNMSRAGTRVGLPVTTTEGLSYLTDQEKSVNQRISEAYTGSTLSKIIGTPDDAMRTLTKMKDVALSPGQGVVNGIKGLSDFYGIVTGNINNPLSQSMQGVLNNFDALTSDGTKNTLKTIQSLVDEAAKNGQGSAAWETAKQALLNPETALMTVGNSLGTFFPALAASAPLVAAGVPAAIATGVFIALNAASQGGSSGQEALEYVAKQLMNDPTVSMEYALEATILAGRKAGIPAAAISAVINSMPMGRALEGAMLKVSKSSLGRGVGSEILTEIPDETLAKIFSNYASGQDLSTGLGQTAVNATIGAVGGAGAVHGSQTEAGKLTEKVSDLIKSGEVSPSKIAELKNEVSNLIGNVGYGVEPTLDLMSDQFFSGIISQEVAGELSLSGLSPEQIAQNLPAAVAHVESGNRIDPTFVDQFFTDDAEARQIAEKLGYTNPSPEVIKSLTGPISEADAQVKLDEFLSGMTAFESGKPVTAAEAQEMVKDLGLTGLSDSDAISLATKIVESVPADKLAPVTKMNIDPAVEKAIADAVGKINLPAGITPADVTAAIKTYMTENPSLSLADVAGKITESTKGLATDTSVQTAISTALKNVATTADVNSAIANIKFPAGITVADVANQIKTALAANPGLTANDVAKSISTYMTANPGLSAADVKTAIDASTKDFATKKDIEAAISGIKFPVGLTNADVSKAIDDYMKANPGLTLRQVADAIATATGGLPTEAGVKTTVADALKGVATKSDVTDAIAGIKFPPGLSKNDVVSAITTYMKDNPGLSIAEVAGKITDATKGLVTSADMKLALGDALKGIATTADVKALETKLTGEIAAAIASGLTGNEAIQKGLETLSTKMGTNQTELLNKLGTTETAITAKMTTGLGELTTKIEGINKSLTDAISVNEAAGLTRDQATTKAIADVATQLGTTKTDLLNQLGTTEAALTTKLTTGLADVAAKVEGINTSLTAAIAANEAAGLTRDQATQKAINDVANQLGTTKADLLTQLGTTEAALTTKLTTGLAEVNTKIEGINKSLTDAIAVNEAAGLTRDQATTKAISDVATQLGTTKSDLLTQLGTTEAALTTKLNTGLADVNTKIESINNSLTTAIADAKATGLTGDAALQAAINKVAADQKVDSAALLTSIGATEASLKTQFASEIAGVTKDIQTKYDALTQAQKDAVNAQVQQGKDLTKAITDATSGLQGQIDTLSGATRTQYDSLTQAQKDAVASQVQQGKDLTRAIADSASGLQTQITGLSSDVQAKYDALTQAQKDAVASQVQQGKDLTTVINNTASGLQTQITGLSSDVQAKYDALTQAQKDAVAAQVQQGVDLTKAITDSSSGLQTQITNLSGDLQTKYDALTQGQRDIVNAQTKQGVDLNTAINEVSKVITKDVADVKKDVGTLRTDTQTRFDLLDQGQKDLVISQVKLGVDVEKAIDDASKKTTQQITDVKTDLKKDIGDAQSQFNTRVDDLVKQGDTYQTATQKALDEIKATQAAEKVAAEAAAKAGRATMAQQGIARNLQQAAARVAPAPGLVDTSTPGFADIGLKTSGDAAKFEGPLEQYMKMLAGNSYAAKPQDSQQTQQVAPVQDELSAQQQPQQGSDYFNYGQQTDIDLAQSPGTQMLYSKAGGLATPLFADGGTTRHGRYAGGGLNVVEHAGKHRIDFRTGNAVTGPGDGQSDDIPAMLADGEFVFPADVVAALGNGSTKAGSDKLYDMMHSIRAYHRSAKPQDLPPPAKKSPLDYLKNRKVRR